MVLVKFVKDFNFQISGNDTNGKYIDEEQTIKKGTVCEVEEIERDYRKDWLIIPREYVTEDIWLGK